jgi:hypothetical protein
MRFTSDCCHRIRVVGALDQEMQAEAGEKRRGTELAGEVILSLVKLFEALANKKSKLEDG